jgi:hypothetical protein
VFTEIDRKVHGTVCFRDSVVANIEGRGTIMFKCKTGEHKLLVGVYMIPCLTANIVSLGQLEEDGHKIIMHADFLKIWDHHGRVVAKVKRVVNRLYVIRLDIDRPMCLAAQGDSPAWCWHVRIGHLRFRGLWLPWIDHVDQVCDSCLTDKRRHLSFPGEAKYRVANKL